MRLASLGIIMFFVFMGVIISIIANGIATRKQYVESCVGAGITEAQCIFKYNSSRVGNRNNNQ